MSERLLSSNRSLFYHFGPQGETRELTDSTGAVVSTYRYDAYGKLLSSTGTDPNPYRYGGKVGYYTDGPMGLILAGQRWYSPHLMRWMTRDPIHYEGGDNLYGYVGGRPTAFVDPSGELPKFLVPDYVIDNVKTAVNAVTNRALTNEELDLAADALISATDVRDSSVAMSFGNIIPKPPIYISKEQKLFIKRVIQEALSEAEEDDDETLRSILRRAELHFEEALNRRTCVVKD